MLGTNTLSLRVGGAAFNGANLLPAAAVFAAVGKAGGCVGSAVLCLAFPIRTVLEAHPPRYSTRVAAVCRAHGLFAFAAVLEASPPGSNWGDAPIVGADSVGPVFRADFVVDGSSAAPFGGAKAVCAVLDAQSPRYSVCIAAWMTARRFHLVF